MYAYVLKQETVPSGNGRTLCPDQWGLGVGQGRGADVKGGSERLDEGAGLRKLWLCGGLVCFKDYHRALCTECRESSVRFFLDHASHLAPGHSYWIDWQRPRPALRE